jgi:hypothetical protein
MKSARRHIHKKLIVHGPQLELGFYHILYNFLTQTLKLIGLLFSPILDNYYDLPPHIDNIC